MADLHILRPSLVFTSPLHILTFAVVIVLLPSAVKGDRSAQFLTTATLAVPLLTLNPLLVSLLFERTVDHLIVRLSSVAPLSLVLVATGYRVAPYLWRQWDELQNRRMTRTVVLGGAAGIVAMLAAVAVPLRAVDVLGPTYFDSSARDSVLTSRRNELQPDEGVFRYLRESVDSDAVILSDRVWSYHIAGLTGQPVVYVKKLHWPGNVSTEENLIRRSVEETVFPTPPSDVADLYGLLMSWQVEYVLVDHGVWPDWELVEDGHGLLAPVFIDGEIVIYEVIRSPPPRAESASHEAR